MSKGYEIMVIEPWEIRLKKALEEMDLTERQITMILIEVQKEMVEFGGSRYFDGYKWGYECGMNTGRSINGL